MARHSELASSAGRRFYSDVAIFGALATFLVLGGIVYGVFSGEASGTILLVLTGVFAAIVAGYLGLQDRLERRAAGTETEESDHLASSLQFDPSRADREPTGKFYRQNRFFRYSRNTCPRFSYERPFR